MKKMNRKTIHWAALYHSLACAGQRLYSGFRMINQQQAKKMADKTIDSLTARQASTTVKKQAWFYLGKQLPTIAVRSRLDPSKGEVKEVFVKKWYVVGYQGQPLFFLCDRAAIGQPSRLNMMPEPANGITAVSKQRLRLNGKPIIASRPVLTLKEQIQFQSG